MKQIDMSIEVLFGGPSAEHWVSIQSARTIVTALRQVYTTVWARAIDQKAFFASRRDSELYLYTQDLPNIPSQSENRLSEFMNECADVVFPIVHGAYGEDGTLSGLLQILGKVTVGTDLFGHANCYHKMSTRLMIDALGIPVLPTQMIDKESIDMVSVENGRQNAHVHFSSLRFPKESVLKLPIFVKPNSGGSSLGCTFVRENENIVTAINTAFAYDDLLLIEPALKFREIECAVFKDASGCIRVSVPGEIKPAAEFYDFEDKYIDDAAALMIPAELSEVLKNKIQKYAHQIFEKIVRRGYARIDFFVLEDESCVVNEINTLPGFTQISMFPKLFAYDGITIESLLKQLIDAAVVEHQRKRRL